MDNDVVETIILNPMQSEQLDQLATALAKAQGTMSNAITDSANPYFKTKYADLASVWEACRSSLSKNGLCVVQTMGYDEKKALCVITTLMHASGQWIRSMLPIITSKNDAQSLGSAITYMRRYSLASIVGIAPGDDDGESAMGRNQCKAALHQEKDYISHEQFRQISALLREHPDYMKKILDGFQIDSATFLEARLFPKILERAQKYVESCKLAQPVEIVMEASLSEVQQ